MSRFTYQSTRTGLLPNRKYRIAFQGGTAAGKSALIQRLEEEQPLWECHPEPVEVWKNYDGVDYLGKFQAKPNRYTRMQLDRVILQSYEDIFHSESSPQIQIYERSQYAAAYVFSKVNLKMGYLELEDVVALQEEYQHRQQVEPFKMDATVYLRVSPDLCLQRRQARMGDTGDGLDPEGNVLGREYEQATFQCHEDIFGPDKPHPPNGTLIVEEIDGEFTLEEKVQRIMRFISEAEFLNGGTYLYRANKPLPFPI